jgi:hypothetical protein
VHKAKGDSLLQQIRHEQLQVSVKVKDEGSGCRCSYRYCSCRSSVFLVVVVGNFQLCRIGACIRLILDLTRDSPFQQVAMGEDQQGQRVLLWLIVIADDQRISLSADLLE